MSEAEKHETVLDTGAEELGKTYAAAMIVRKESADHVPMPLQRLHHVGYVRLHRSELQSHTVGITTPAVRLATK